MIPSKLACIAVHLTTLQAVLDYTEHWHVLICSQSMSHEHDIHIAVHLVILHAVLDYTQHHYVIVCSEFTVHEHDIHTLLIAMMCVQQLQALGDTVGVVSRGAVHNIMDSLQKCLYAQHKPDQTHEDCTEQ